MDKGGGQDEIGKKMFNAEFMSYRRFRNIRKLYIEMNQDKKGKNINQSNPIILQGGSSRRR